MRRGRRTNNLIEFLIVFAALFIILMWRDARDISVPQFVEQVIAPLSHPQEPVILLFAGDVMLGRHVGVLIARNGTHYPFEKILPETQSLKPDLFIANLEGPITMLDAPDERVSPEQPYSMRFHFDPSVVESLTHAGFTHLSVANNHAFDQGKEGREDTVRYLQQASINTFGFRDGTALGTVSREKIHGHDLVLIGLDTTIVRYDLKELSQELDAFPEDAFVVTFLHWGNEYEHGHSQEQEAFAHILIDHGVDLIIGAHPHVIQDNETYKGKAIFYSLGNFVFDQYWNTDVQTGLMVKVILDDDISYEEISIKSIYSQPFLADQVSL
jgi:poly-gamma-glutamate capsule biosynthesis protein CapA/YwtB (metallophosphatase superfamily)